MPPQITACAPPPSCCSQFSFPARSKPLLVPTTRLTPDVRSFSRHQRFLLSGTHHHARRARAVGRSDHQPSSCRTHAWQRFLSSGEKPPKNTEQRTAAPSQRRQASIARSTSGFRRAGTIGIYGNRATTHHLFNAQLRAGYWHMKRQTVAVQLFIVDMFVLLARASRRRLPP